MLMENTEMDFIEVCMNYRLSKISYENFCKIAKDASSLGEAYVGAPEVFEYMAVFESTWALLENFFSVDFLLELKHEIRRLQRYEITLNSFEVFMDQYRKELSNKKEELHTEVQKWAEKMEEVYDSLINGYVSDNTEILNNHVVKEFVLQGLCGLKEFKSAEKA